MIASNRFKPVSLAFSNVFGNDPNKLPGPSQSEIYGVKPPKYADDGTTYMLSDGTVWTYKGISAYKVDNMERYNGWERVY